MRHVLRIMRDQYRTAPGLFWLGVLVAVLPAAAGILLLGVAGWFITAAAIAGLSGVFLNIFVPSAIIRALAIIRTAGRYGERVITHDATFRFLADLRNRVFSAYSDGGTSGQRSGLLLNRLTQDIDALDQIYLRLVVPAGVILVCSFALVLFWGSVSRDILLLGLVFLGAWGALALRSFKRADVKAARRADAAREAMRLRTADMASGRTDLAIYGGLENAALNVLEADRRFADAEETGERRTNRLLNQSSFIGQVFLASTLLLCVLGVMTQTLSPALAIGLVLLVLALPELFGQMLPGLSRLPRMALAAARVKTAQSKNVCIAPDTIEAGPGLAADKPPVLQFRDVTFGYPGAARIVLDTLSFEVAPGEVVGVAGRSGCGKSTVASLASRLVVPEAGAILVNGFNLQKIDEPNLRRQITVLGQRPYLFNDTLAANLRIAKEDATDDMLWQALEHAALRDRVLENASGLQTVLGEGGLGLSGGERRRLALARALLTRPTLFILDEMTEGLDDDIAADVLQRFLEFRGSAAVLMIAHKRRELEIADRIIRLDQAPHA